MPSLQAFQSAFRRAAVLVAALLCTGCVTTPRDEPAEAPVRAVTPLTSGWRFHDGPAPVAAVSPAFDDSGWQPVSLPHSWNSLGEYALQHSDKTHNRQGEGWYRLTLDGRSLAPLQRQFLEFDAVGNVADVWVNGIQVAHHAGAFSRFRADITNELHRSGPNVIAVRADNSRPAPGSTTQDVIPLQGDFFIHGGLYRPVSLISVAAAHIDLLDHGGPGVYVRTTSIDDRQADITVLTRLDRGDRKHLMVRTKIEDGPGRGVATAEAAASSNEVSQAIKIPDPHRWDGRKDPHLYTATVELLDQGRVVDRVRQNFGIRSFRFDPNEGFFLNGKHLALHGVSRHQDLMGKGWAISHADHARDMAIIEELGANTIRMAHYEHAEDWFDLSDGAGMVVWAEVPFVNKVNFGDAPATPQLESNAREQLIELIRQNYNHPSVVTWSIGNETNIDLAFGRIGPKADPGPLLDRLRALAHKEDADRPTVVADCCEDTPSVKIAGLPPIADHSELMGYNRYYGWYYGKIWDLGPDLDRLHAKHPNIPISVSEYGAGAALSQHSDNPEGGPINAGGRPHPEEFQGWLHEQSWPQLKSRPYLFATWIWNMFDFSSTVRNEGDAIDINDKGLVTFDRKVRKDAFYYYQSQWRDDVPVLHITGRRYVERAYPIVDVRIYSNVRHVSVSLNGARAGQAECSDHVCVLRNVHLRPGSNTVEAVGEFQQRPVTDRVEWIAPDAAQGLSIKAGDLTGFKDSGGRLVGSDNWFSGGTTAKISSKSVKTIEGGYNPRMLSTLRTGSFHYSIPLPNGRWRVRLLFVAADEPIAASAVTSKKRVLLSVPALPPRHAAWRSGSVQVRDGVLDLAFGPRSSLAFIEIRPQA